MKTLCSDIIRIYKKAPLKISIIWLMDLLESLIMVVNPYIIGICIDDIAKQNYSWLIVLICLDILLGILSTINKWLDTRVYSRIIEEEANSYYSNIFSTNATDSLINSRLNLISCIPNFLETNIIHLLNMILGIIFSLFYLYYKSKMIVFVAAICISILIPIITYNFQAEITQNYKNYKTLDEKRVVCISSRNLKVFKKFINKILRIEVSNSDLDSKIYIYTYFLQTALLIIAIISIVNTKGFTIGLLLSTVTYVEMLNDYTSEINYAIILIKDLIETSERLKNFEFEYH